ncbi:uncharacterized protein RCC_04899 [Ramularia collo-cygni]|uniref:Uncharacterized protein n=1 Tax=Ramularia collo-cygni TaxID=112498 RepID=A0A2D3VEL5_9PEZI|nr:uncharacterized protein RCC_04899 [Ramularia collo-cygni]CZT19053.1 uncharacterized protein RCC_04899 [Ramularia collo-cygni]
MRDCTCWKAYLYVEGCDEAGTRMVLRLLLVSITNTTLMRI